MLFGSQATGGMMMLKMMGIDPQEFEKEFEQFRRMAVGSFEMLEKMRLGIEDIQANQQVILLSTQRLESALVGVSPAGETAAQYEVVPFDETNVRVEAQFNNGKELV